MINNCHLVTSVAPLYGEGEEERKVKRKSAMNLVLVRLFRLKVIKSLQSGNIKAVLYV